MFQPPDVEEKVAEVFDLKVKMEMKRKENFKIERYIIITLSKLALFGLLEEVFW